MFLIKAFLGKSWIYIAAAVAIAAVYARQIFKARRAGAKAERDKQVQQRLRDMRASRDAIDASRRLTDDEVRAQLKKRHGGTKK